MKRILSLLLSITMIILLMPTFSLSASALNAEVVSVDLVSLPTRTYYENDSVFTGPWDLNGCVLEVTFTDETTRTIDCSEDLYKTGDYDFTNYGFFSGEYSDPSDANEDYYFISYETVWDDNEGMDVVGFNLFFNTSGNSYPIGTINLENSNVTDFELVYSPEPEIDLATDSFYCVEYGNDTDNRSIVTIDDSIKTTISLNWLDYDGCVFDNVINAISIDDNYASVDFDNNTVSYMGYSTYAHLKDPADVDGCLSLSSYPTKSEYYEGEDFSITGGIISSWDDINEVTEEIPITEKMVYTNVDTTRVGTYKVYVFYNDFYTNYDVTVKHNFTETDGSLVCSFCGVETKKIKSVELLSLPTRPYYLNDYNSMFNGVWDLNGCVIEVTYEDDTIRTINCSDDLYEMSSNNFSNYGFFSGEYSEPSTPNADFFFISCEYKWDEEEGMEIVGYDLFFNTLGQKYSLGTLYFTESNVTEFQLESTPEYDVDFADGSVYRVVYDDDYDNPTIITISDDIKTTLRFLGFSNGGAYSEVKNVICIDDDYASINGYSLCYRGFSAPTYVNGQCYEILTYPTKTEYFEGEELDAAGGAIVYYDYANDTEEIIPITEDMLSYFDGPEAGFCEIEINYNDLLYDSYFISIRHDFTEEDGKLVCSYCGEEVSLIDSVELITPASRTYYIGDPIFKDGPYDLSGLKVKVNYANGDERIADVDTIFTRDGKDDKYYYSYCYIDSCWTYYEMGQSAFEMNETTENYVFFDWEKTDDNSFDLYLNNLGQRFYVYTIDYQKSDVTSINLSEVIEKGTSVVGLTFSISYCNGDTEEYEITEDNYFENYLDELRAFTGEYYRITRHFLSDNEVFRINDDYAVVDTDNGVIKYMGKECPLYGGVKDVELISAPTDIFYEGDSLLSPEFCLTGLSFKVIFNDNSEKIINCPEDLYGSSETVISNFGFLSEDNTDCSEDNPDFYFFDCREHLDDNDDFIGYDLYFNNNGQEFFVCTVVPQDSNIESFYLVDTPTKDVDLAKGSTYCIEYYDGTSEEIIISDDMRSTVSFVRADYYSYDENEYDVLLINGNYSRIDLEGHWLYYLNHSAATRIDSAWIYIESTPKTVYCENEELNLDDGIICVCYDTGVEEFIPITQEMISDFNTSEVGTFSVKVTYNAWTTSYEITVQHNLVCEDGTMRCTACGQEVTAVESVDLIQAPSRTYYIGDNAFARGPADLTDCIVDVNYANGTTKRIDFNSCNAQNWYEENDANAFLNYGSFSGECTEKSVFNSDYFFFDWDDNGDNTFDLYLNTCGSRIKVCTVNYIETNVTGISIANLLEPEDSLIGAIFTITYSDETTEDIEVTEDMIVNPYYGWYDYYSGSGYSLTEGTAIKVNDSYIDVNTYTGIATYMGCECRVYPAGVDGMWIGDYPKREYYENDSLDLTGGTIVVAYDDGTEEAVLMTEDMLCNPVALNEVGEYQVELSYNGDEFSFWVTVKHRFMRVGDENVCSECGATIPIVDHYQLVSAPTHTYYNQDTVFKVAWSDGEYYLYPYDLNGCVVDVYYADGTITRIDCNEDLYQMDNTLTNFGFISGVRGVMSDVNPDFFFFNWEAVDEDTVDLYFNTLGVKGKICSIDYIDSPIVSVDLIGEHVGTMKQFENINLVSMADIFDGYYTFEQYACGYALLNGSELPYTRVETGDYSHIDYYNKEDLETEVQKYFDISPEEIRAGIPTTYTYFQPDYNIFYNSERDEYGFYNGGCYTSGPEFGRYGYIETDGNQYDIYFEYTRKTDSVSSIPESGTEGYDYIPVYDDEENLIWVDLYEHNIVEVKTECVNEVIKVISVSSVDEFPNAESGITLYPSDQDYKDILIGSVIKLAYKDNTTEEIEITEDLLTCIDVYFCQYEGGGGGPLSIYEGSYDLIECCGNYVQVSYAKDRVDSLGKIRFMGNEIPILREHSFNQEIIDSQHLKSAATCSSPAVYYYGCTCGEIGEETFEYGSPLDHAYGEWTAYNNTQHKRVCTNDPSHIEYANHVFDQQVIDADYLKSAATCTDKAVYYYSCTCGEKGTETFEYGLPNGHTWDEGEVTTEPTCTVEGVMTYTCSACGEMKTEPIAKIAHTFNQQVVDDQYLKSAATCTQSAVYYYSCICGEKGEATFEHGLPIEHSWNEGEVTTSATCTIEGVMTYTCSDCSATKTEPIAKITHTFNQQVIDAQYLKSAATCTDKAVYFYSCTCGEKGTETFEYGLPTGHSYGAWITYDENRHKRICETDSSHIEYANHTWDDGEATIAPTCTSEGVMTYTCSECGETKTEPIAKIAHSHEESTVITAPTCAAEGVMEYVCSVCGDTITEAIPATGHTFVKIVSDEYLATLATCRDKATYYYSCSDCGAAGTETFEFGRTTDNHIWDDGIVTREPTCSKEGVMLYTCAVCGETKTEPVATISHTYEFKAISDEYLKSAATCTQPAVYYYSCECGEKGTDDYTFEYGLPNPDNHVWDEGVATTPATLTEDGVLTYTCTLCGEVNLETEVIPMASKVTASASSYTYNGKVQKPTVTVKDRQGNTIPSSNYTLTWSNSSSKVAGSYTVKVTFKGNYSGSKTFTYKILPRQVSGLKFKSATTSSVTITWTKLTEAKYYKVEYSTDGKTWKTASTVSTNSATVKNLKAGTKYQLRVTALDSTKKVAGKASAVLKTGTLCAKPAISSLKSAKAGQATATWGKVTGASKYIVYKSTDNKKWTKVTTTTKTSYTLTGLTKGKKIYVKIVAVNAYSKNSPDSAVKSVTVKK